MTLLANLGLWLSLYQAGVQGVPAEPDSRSIGGRLMAETAVKSALSAIERGEPELLDEQIRLCEIPAPPFKEHQRAAALERAFRALALANVRIDAVGNVLGDRPGTSPRPRVVFSAHLDTVFPEGTNVETTRSGSVIRGPGIGDDCRGLAVVLGVIRAMNQANIQTPGTITFVGTVGEEGLGDLRGVKHLFSDELKGS
jgi:tripeptide aminopeptidase